MSTTVDFLKIGHLRTELPDEQKMTELTHDIEI